MPLSVVFLLLFHKIMIVSNNTTFHPNFQGDKTTKFAGSDGYAMIHLETLLFCLAGGKGKGKRKGQKLKEKAEGVRLRGF